MKLREIPVWEPGELVQVKKGVNGEGEVGMVLGPGVFSECLRVLFSDRAHDVHPTNLQKPDGRTRRRG